MCPGTGIEPYHDGEARAAIGSDGLMAWVCLGLLAAAPNSVEATWLESPCSVAFEDDSDYVFVLGSSF